MKHTGRAALALLLLISGYLVALALGLATLLAALGLLRTGLTVSSVAALVVPLLALATLVLLWNRARAARAAHVSDGIALAQTAQPRLWADVFSLADRIDSRAPDEIWVVDRVGVALEENSPMLGQRPGSRRLMIGIPLMLGLSAEQLRWVIAHELAHDSRRQPALRTRAYRGVQSVRRMRAGLGGSATERLLTALGRAVEAVAAPALHAHELESDELAAELVGGRTAVAALKELGPLDEAWQEFCERYVLPAVLVGQRPTGLFGGFVEFLDDEDRQGWMETFADRHPQGAPAAEGHPTESVRIAALKELATSRKLDFSGAAEDVLDRRDVVFEALEGAVTAGSDLLPGPFDRVVPKGTAAQVAAQVTALGESARQLDLWPLTDSTLLQVARAGRTAPLMRALAPDADGDQLDALAGRVVADLAAHRLVEAGKARFVLSWSAAPALIDRHGETLDPWSVAARATRSPEGLAELEEWLAVHGTRTVRREPPATAPPPITPAPVAPAPVAVTPTATAPATPPAEPSALPAAVAVSDPPSKIPGKLGLKKLRPSPLAKPASPEPAPAPVGLAGEPATPAPVLATLTAPAAHPLPDPDLAAAPTGHRTTPRDLVDALLRRIGAPAEPTAEANGQDATSVAAVEEIVRDRWGEGDAADTDNGAGTGPAEATASEEHDPEEAPSPATTHREALKAALKERDRLRRAQEQAQREAAERAAAEAREKAEREATAAREAAAFAARADEDELGPEVDPGADPTEDDRDDPDERDDHQDELPPAPSLNPDLAAAIAALAPPRAVDEVEDQLEDASEAASPQVRSTSPVGHAPPETTSEPEGEPEAAFTAIGPVPPELSGVIAAAAPVSGSAKGTMVITLVGISLRRAGVTEMARLVRQGAARGATMLARATALSLQELVGHRGTQTLSWSDITRAEFSGLSEDQGVLTLYVGSEPAQRVEFLDTTEIHGDLLGALERLLGPRLRIS
jgi:Zn-dependent protease with chaperone function/DNA-binding transcriptional regulator YdaS (Cro superfamily)